MQTQTLDEGVRVTFDNGDTAIVYVKEEQSDEGPVTTCVTLSTYGGGYNGAIRMTSEEANEFGALLVEDKAP